MRWAQPAARMEKMRNEYKFLSVNFKEEIIHEVNKWGDKKKKRILNMIRRPALD
jgi:hypothetical protein